MLDSKTKTLLSTINRLSNDGYTVLSFEEILTSLPIDMAFSQSELYQTLSELNVNEYLSIKYQDDSEVCLCVLPKCRLLFEQCEKDDFVKYAQKRTNLKYCFLGAFSGGVIGGVISVLLTVLLSKC